MMRLCALVHKGIFVVSACFLEQFAKKEVEWTAYSFSPDARRVFWACGLDGLILFCTYYMRSVWSGRGDSYEFFRERCTRIDQSRYT